MNFRLALFCFLFSGALHAQSAGNGWPILAGTEDGLFGIDPAGRATALWTGGAVRKIVSIGDTWAILGSEGIFVSAGLQSWERRNQGLPVKTVKIFQEGKKSFVQMVQEIKALEFCSSSPEIMVCATKDRVYLSRNQGRTWTSLGAPPYRTNGIKAVAAAYMPDGSAAELGAGVLTVFMSHSTYGLFYIQPDRSGAKWTELSRGLEKLETTDNADEVSCIAVRIAAPSNAPEIYAAQTFRRRLYRLDWNRKSFTLIWKDDSPFGTTDSLDPGKDGIRFLYEGTAAELAYTGAEARLLPGITAAIRGIAVQRKPACVVLRENRSPGAERVTFSELWLLDEKSPGQAGSPAPAAKAAGKEGLYLPVNHAADSRSLEKYFTVIAGRGLNMIVIDMKDDYGRLRFSPHNPAIAAKGRVFRPLDIDALLLNMKARGLYTVARIVVFKDPELAKKENGAYAVWDRKNNKPWAGYYDSRRGKDSITDADRQNDLKELLPADDPAFEIVRTFYDERWVDPYSEEVWEYTAAVAEELHARGFDEIQFDYIRFPTDGVNLGDAAYRWQDPGMDMESAVLSFLRHVRGRVAAPISIDIYGANGWYRTGARTGQEVELLAPWVDVICPMYYPSHFEQDFLAQNPPEERPYRIYHQGTLRTARIGRGQVIVRPYVQTFYLNVSYDRAYYNPDYVRRELAGVRAAGAGGFTCWNNSGRYDDLSFE